MKMQYKFQDLIIGDLFNTKAGRWVKISNEEAICVMSSIIPIGGIKKFEGSCTDIVLLWSAILVVN